MANDRDFSSRYVTKETLLTDGREGSVPRRATPSRPARTSILIVDDHPLFRRGLIALLESKSDLGVCAQAATCAVALEAVSAHAPDLVTVDLALEGANGLQLLFVSTSSRTPRVA